MIKHKGQVGKELLNRLAPNSTHSKRKEKQVYDESLNLLKFHGKGKVNG